jgi:hypothetical protein
MESHRFEKNRGEGPAAPLPLPPAESPICEYRDVRGHRCRLPVVSESSDPESADATALDPGLCAFHTRRLADRRRATETTAAELLASVGDFTDPASVNRFLANLARQVALKHIPRRDGVALAYICQLILNSQAAQDRRQLLQYELARLDSLHEESKPTRVIWDLPARAQNPPACSQESEAVPTPPTAAAAPSPAPPILVSPNLSSSPAPPAPPLANPPTAPNISSVANALAPSPLPPAQSAHAEKTPAAKAAPPASSSTAVYAPPAQHPAPPPSASPPGPRHPDPKLPFETRASIWDGRYQPPTVRDLLRSKGDDFDRKIRQMTPYRRRHFQHSGFF